MDLREPRLAFRFEATLDEELALVGDDDFVEMATLDPGETGLPGHVFISTRMTSHGPRVKGWFGRPGGDQPSFSVSIAENPVVLASSLGDPETGRAAAPVIAWTRANRAALLDFWTHGRDWTNREVQAFIAGLERADQDGHR